MIEGLDELDRIKILGVSTERLSFADASVHGLSGVGIFADGILEALYTGGDLNSDQLGAITTRDASELVLNNQLWSYRFAGSACPSLDRSLQVGPRMLTASVDGSPVFARNPVRPVGAPPPGESVRTSRDRGAFSH